MNEVFEKILEELDKQSFYMQTQGMNQEKFICTKKATEIIKKVSEEYNDGWIPCSDHLPKENGYYFVTQIEKSISNGKKIAVNTDYVEFSEGRWARAKHLEVIAWLDIKPYQPKGE